MPGDVREDRLIRRLERAALAGWIAAWSVAAVAGVRVFSGTFDTREPVAAALVPTIVLILWPTVALSLAAARHVAVARSGDVPLPMFDAWRLTRRIVMTVVPGAVVAWCASPGSAWPTLAWGAMIALVAGALIALPEILDRFALLPHRPCAGGEMTERLPDSTSDSSDGSSCSPCGHGSEAVISPPAQGRWGISDVEEEWDDEPTDDEAGDDASLVQRFRRGRTEAGERIEGLFRVDFPAGQRLVALHIPFAPPLATPPDVTAAPADGDEEFRTTVAAALRFGVRIDVRRTTALEPQSAWIGVEASTRAARRAA